MTAERPRPSLAARLRVLMRQWTPFHPARNPAAGNPLLLFRRPPAVAVPLADGAQRPRRWRRAQA